jgi:urease accessory protein
MGERMGIATNLPMTTNMTPMPAELSPAQLMTLTQWLSPAFPIGAFSYSHGLEFALQSTPALDLEAWLAGILRHGAGRNDAILILAAHSGQIDEADALARALSPSSERLLETAAQGAAFCKALRDAFGLDLVELTYPVALGAAAAEKKMPVEPVTTLYLHAVVTNLIGAAQRLAPLGQSKAQAMIDRLSPTCAEIAANTACLGLDDLGGAAWLADVAAMQHEDMETRIFRT